MLPSRPTIAEYDAAALRWIYERVLPRRNTTQRIIGKAWAEERRLLTPEPGHLLERFAGDDGARAALRVVDAAQRQLGEHVEIRPLSAYEVL